MIKIFFPSDWLEDEFCKMFGLPTDTTAINGSDLYDHFDGLREDAKKMDLSLEPKWRKKRLRAWKRRRAMSHYKNGPYTYMTTEVDGKYEIVVHDDLEGVPGRVGIESLRIEVDKKLYTIINKAIEAAYVSGKRAMAEIIRHKLGIADD